MSRSSRLLKPQSINKTTLSACALNVMAGKPMTTKIPTCFSPRLVSPSSSRRHAYRRSYAARSRLTMTDVGLTPRLAYARVMHTAPGCKSRTDLTRSLSMNRPKTYYCRQTFMTFDLPLFAVLCEMSILLVCFCIKQR